MPFGSLWLAGLDGQHGWGGLAALAEFLEAQAGSKERVEQLG